MRGTPPQKAKLYFAILEHPGNDDMMEITQVRPGLPCAGHTSKHSTHTIIPLWLQATELALHAKSSIQKASRHTLATLRSQLGNKRGGGFLTLPDLQVLRVGC